MIDSQPKSAWRPWRSWRRGGSILPVILAACSSPSPATSSSSHWVTCSTMAECASVAGAAACTDGYCVDSSGQRLESGGSPNPTPTSCDPLAPHELPVTLGTVLGIGKDSKGTVYVADEVPGKSIDRVFVSSGNSLFRKHVSGTGSSGGGADAEYNFSFTEVGDPATARSLLIEHRGGVVTAMGLGPDGRGFIGDPGAVTETLTVLDANAISGLTLRNLPGDVYVEYVADVANGNVIVVTRPDEDWTYEDFRLFYGSQDHMIERPVVSVARGNSTDVLFTVNGTQYDVHFQLDLFPTDGGGAGTHHGPDTLDTGGGTPIDVTERLPIPTSLPGFTFSCL